VGLRFSIAVTLSTALAAGLAGQQTNQPTLQLPEFDAASVKPVDMNGEILKVEQEFWGLLMAHYAIRGLMHEAALSTDIDPDQLSFLHSVRVVQRRMARYAAIPPSAEEHPA
jgi:hypothetical protein